MKKGTCILVPKSKDGAWKLRGRNRWIKKTIQIVSINCEMEWQNTRSWENSLQQIELAFLEENATWNNPTDEKCEAEI